MRYEYKSESAGWNGMLGEGDIRALYNMATTEGLKYNASQVQQLFKLYSQGDDSARLDLNGKVWKLTNGLSASADGQVNAPGNVSKFELVLDAEAGRGVVTVAVGTLILIK